MLEVKNLCKSYKSGDGAIVEATKNISLRFPERGMVFLLGRSGSGKSTLLHLLGGLDRYDSGEILIHHTSTKDFTDAMMDSYRNTYVGYVFQDYNILPEFTVGANIGLAMELQGEKASPERIDELLSLVDLEGLAKRRPNELSGGQLQRVAIARALIKNPDIILADEPTGALDSATGRQVFETFKKLSQEKLVIIVSHDRDYSERYADRIIELADGEVISDVELKPVEELSEIHEIRLPEESGLHFSENGIVAEPWTVITDEDRSVINEYLKLQAAGDVLLVDEHTVTPKKGRFQTTSENRIVEEKKEFRLIKSRLPWKRSLGIGVNSMKHKKITLVFTLLLSIAAFTMFGLADVFRSFDRVTCMVDSLRDSGQKYLAIYKQSTDRYASNFDYDLKAEDVEYLKEGLGDRFVATRSLGLGSFVYYDETDHSGIQLDNFARYVYPRFSYNGMELDESACERLGLSLAAGRLPEPGTNEVCVSNLAAEFMVTYGFADLKDCPIEDTIGLTLTNKKNGRKVKIVGIVNTQVDVELYRKMLKPDEELHNDSDWLLFQVYSRNAQFECIYGLPGVLFYAPGSFETKISSNELNSFSVSDESMYLNIGSVGSYKNPAHLYTSIENVPEDSICWFEDGKTELAEGEILISVDTAIAWQFEAVNDGSGMLLSGLEETAEDYRNSDFYRAVMRLPDKYFNVGRDCDSRKFRIVGMYVNEGNRSASAVVMNNGDLKEYEAIMQDPISAIFAPIPDSDSELRKNVAYLNRDRNGARFEIQSRATMGIEEANEIADFMAPALTVIGTVMAIFSAVLFSVFIANSVLRKRQEIGVLRAIGARSLDVYRIFLCEVGLIAAFNWLASVGLTFLFTGRINSGLRRETVIQLTLFHAGKRQVLYIFAIAAVVSIVATFLPVWGIARKKPIDVIRDR